MEGKEYSIQPGDNFYCLAQRWGGTCDDFIQVNPSVNPLKLQVGQKIVLPEFKGTLKGQEQYADISVDQGHEFAGEHLDEVEMEVEGVHFRLRRIGEPRIPHEVHFILPRTEIRKVQPAGECGPCEVQIMLSNLDIVHSPRLVSGKGDSAEQGKPAPQPAEQKQAQQAPQQQQQQQVQAQENPQTQMQQMQQTQFNSFPQYGQGAQPTLEQSQGFMPAQEQPRRRITFPFKRR